MFFLLQYTDLLWKSCSVLSFEKKKKSESKTENSLEHLNFQPVKMLKPLVLQQHLLNITLGVLYSAQLLIKQTITIALSHHKTYLFESDV